jgi:hypothetical protein
MRSPGERDRSPYGFRRHLLFRKGGLGTRLTRDDLVLIWRQVHKRIGDVLRRGHPIVVGHVRFSTMGEFER